MFILCFSVICSVAVFLSRGEVDLERFLWNRTWLILLLLLLTGMLVVAGHSRIGRNQALGSICNRVKIVLMTFSILIFSFFISTVQGTLLSTLGYQSQLAYIVPQLLCKCLACTVHLVTGEDVHAILTCCAAVTTATGRAATRAYALTAARHS